MKQSLMPKDYKKYKERQVERAEHKWARKELHDHVFKQNLERDWKKIRDHLPEAPTKIICMGCRDGTELFEFKRFYPRAMVTGVDLTENVKTIRVSKMRGVDVRVQDFSNLPEAWGKLFDIVFSNSLDHAYNPHETVKEWHRVCKGHLFVQLATANKPNQIEHCFERHDVYDLFPEKLFNILEVWENETINVLAEVKHGTS